jgi:hypothetical protein
MPIRTCLVTNGLHPSHSTAMPPAQIGDTTFLWKTSEAVINEALE